MRILITGSSGALGSVLVKAFNRKYELRGLDRTPNFDMEDNIVGDIADFDTVVNATSNIDAVIHLAAAMGGHYPWEDILRNNIIGTYNVVEAARVNKVRRFVFASRAGILKPEPEDAKRTVEMLPKPLHFYSISKIFGENIGYMYSVRFDMEVVCVRIGNFKTENILPKGETTLSHADAVQLFEKAVTHPGVRYEVVFGVSDPNNPRYDMEHASNAIGYKSRDSRSKKRDG